MKGWRRLLLLALIAGLSLASMAGAASAAAPLGKLDRDQFIHEHFAGRALDPVEGVWLTGDLKGEIAIVKHQPSGYPEYEYAGVVVATTSRSYKLGDLKLLLRTMADPRMHRGLWFPERGAPQETVFGLTDEDTIRYGANFDPETTEPEVLLRTYPKEGEEPSGRRSGTVSGTGFFVAQDLVATNHHVIEGAEDITLTLADGTKVAGSVVARDPFNDLALIRLSHPAEGVRVLSVGDVAAVRSGQRVYTIGFPMPSDLGTNAKLGEGIVNSITGFEDDPRMYQISLPVQPGNSGGPLLDTRGRVIGVVTASMDSMYSLVRSGTVPQNVNFAMKINYLDNLVAVLPSGPALSREASPSDLEAADLMSTLRPAIVLITAK